MSLAPRPAPGPTGPESNAVRWVGRAFSVAGAAVVLGGAIWLAVTYAYLSNAVRVEGRVVELVAPSEKTRAPIVEYVANGETYRMTGVISNVYVPQIGEAVPVLYHRDHPEDARRDSLVATYLFPLALVMLGLTFAGVGAITLRRARG